MNQPVSLDIPHQLGRAEARARIERGIGKLAGMIPGGAVVDHTWEGDVMYFTVAAMGQRISSKLEPFDDRVHAELDLPPFLALFANQIREKLVKEGPKLLE